MGDKGDTPTHHQESETPVQIQRDHGIGVVLLNRPERLNALNLEMRKAISDAFETLAADPEILVIVVTGGSEVFAAGADLKLLVDKSSKEVAKLNLAGYWRAVARCEKPVIAAVCGHCLGAGAELMQMCDIIVADVDANIGQPEAKVGIMPGAGGTQRLIRSVGKQVASLMLMCGETISGERAFHLGLVSDVTERGHAPQRALELARIICRMPPQAMLAIKRTLAQGSDLPLDEALHLEQMEFLRLFDTADKTEGMSAFLEKRRPRFKGS
ncbi:MAG: enoyl-CoA hydratase-related protein [Pseudomonadota bacterium]